MLGRGAACALPGKPSSNIMGTVLMTAVKLLMGCLPLLFLWLNFFKRSYEIRHRLR